jgi:tryptophanyl-tRNA synthetase
MARLRHAVGLRPLQAPSADAGKSAKSATHSFKQYRGPDGNFYFKWLDTKGQLLLESNGFDQPKAAAQAIAQLQQQGEQALETLKSHIGHQAPLAELVAAFADIKKS